MSGVSRRSDLLNSRRVRIVPKPSVNYEGQIKTLHFALSPLFAHVIQDLSPRAPSRYPFVNGGYTVQFQGWADKDAIVKMIEDHGFTIDPASVVEARPNSPAVLSPSYL